MKWVCDLNILVDVKGVLNLLLSSVLGLEKFWFFIKKDLFKIWI